MTHFVRKIAVGLVVTLMATPIAAWERTTETTIASDGTPLVQITAERGDVLGEPWLVYLMSIGYDVSGNWWNDTAQTLLDYNPEARFVPGTNYGVAVGSNWWLPDVQALQAANSTQSTDVSPPVTQADFVALGGALAEDIEGMKAFQQASEARLTARIEAIEVELAAAAVERAQMSTDISTNRLAIADTQLRVESVSDQVSTLAGSIDGQVRAIVTESVAAQVQTQVSAVAEGLRSDITSLETSTQSSLSRFQTTLIALAALLLLLLGWLMYNTRQVHQLAGRTKVAPRSVVTNASRTPPPVVSTQAKAA